MTEFIPRGGARIATVLAEAVDHSREHGPFSFDFNGRKIEVDESCTVDGLREKYGFAAKVVINNKLDPEVEACVARVDEIDFTDLTAVANWLDELYAFAKKLRFSGSHQQALAEKIRTKQGYDKKDNLRSFWTEENGLTIRRIQDLVQGLELGFLCVRFDD